jgi:hypothetical protein
VRRQPCFLRHNLTPVTSSARHHQYKLGMYRAGIGCTVFSDSVSRRFQPPISPRGAKYHSFTDPISGRPIPLVALWSLRPTFAVQ